MPKLKIRNYKKSNIKVDKNKIIYLGFNSLPYNKERSFVGVYISMKSAKKDDPEYIVQVLIRNVVRRVEEPSYIKAKRKIV